MPKEKVNYQEVDDLYQLCRETKYLKEFCSEYGVNFSLTESCRLNGINPETYLERLFKCIVSKETYDKRQLLPCYIKI